MLHLQRSITSSQREERRSREKMPKRATRTVRRTSAISAKIERHADGPLARDGLENAPELVAQVRSHIGNRNDDDLSIAIGNACNLQ